MDRWEGDYQGSLSITEATHLIQEGSILQINQKAKSNEIEIFLIEDEELVKDDTSYTLQSLPK